jgi:hypothetical protein
MCRKRNLYLMRLVSLSVLGGAVLHLWSQPAVGQSSPAITISSSVPNELNPTGGGAPAATPEQASAFAWQEFIALNWPAGPQQSQPNQREAPAPSSACHFGDPSPSCSLLVWETFRGKVEIFPGNGMPSS